MDFTSTYSDKGFLKHSLQTLTSEYHPLSGIGLLLVEQASHTFSPHALQWCRLQSPINVGVLCNLSNSSAVPNGVEQSLQFGASESGTQ